MSAERINNSEFVLLKQNLKGLSDEDLLAVANLIDSDNANAIKKALEEARNQISSNGFSNSLFDQLKKIEKYKNYSSFTEKINIRLIAEAIKKLEENQEKKKITIVEASNQEDSPEINQLEDDLKKISENDLYILAQLLNIDNAKEIKEAIEKAKREGKLKVFITWMQNLPNFNQISAAIKSFSKHDIPNNLTNSQSETKSEKPLLGQEFRQKFRDLQKIFQNEAYLVSRQTSEKYIYNNLEKDMLFQIKEMAQIFATGSMEDHYNILGINDETFNEKVEQAFYYLNQNDFSKEISKIIDGYQSALDSGKFANVRSITRDYILNIALLFASNNQEYTKLAQFRLNELVKRCGLLLNSILFSSDEEKEVYLLTATDEDPRKKDLEKQLKENFERRKAGYKQRYQEFLQQIKNFDNITNFRKIAHFLLTGINNLDIRKVVEESDLIKENEKISFYSNLLNVANDKQFLQKLTDPSVNGKVNLLKARLGLNDSDSTTIIDQFMEKFYSLFLDKQKESDQVPQEEPKSDEKAPIVKKSKYKIRIGGKNPIGVTAKPTFPVEPEKTTVVEAISDKSAKLENILEKILGQDHNLIEQFTQAFVSKNTHLKLVAIITLLDEAKQNKSFLSTYSSINIAKELNLEFIQTLFSKTKEPKLKAIFATLIYKKHLENPDQLGSNFNLEDLLENDTQNEESTESFEMVTPSSSSSEAPTISRKPAIARKSPEIAEPEIRRRSTENDAELQAIVEKNKSSWDKLLNLHSSSHTPADHNKSIDLILRNYNAAYAIENTEGSLFDLKNYDSYIETLTQLKENKLLYSVENIENVGVAIYHLLNNYDNLSNDKKLEAQQLVAQVLEKLIKEYDTILVENKVEEVLTQNDDFEEENEPTIFELGKFIRQQVSRFGSIDLMPLIRSYKEKALNRVPPSIQDILSRVKKRIFRKSAASYQEEL